MKELVLTSGMFPRLLGDFNITTNMREIGQNRQKLSALHCLESLVESNAATRMKVCGMRHSSTLTACDCANFRTGLEANVLDQPEAFPEVERKKVKRPRKSRTLETAEAGRFASLRKKAIVQVDLWERLAGEPCQPTRSVSGSRAKQSSETSQKSNLGTIRNRGTRSISVQEPYSTVLSSLQI